MNEASYATPSGCLLIVCGLPGSGKTTVSKELGARRSGVRLSPDEWMTALGVNLWDLSMRRRVEALQWEMAQDLLRAGATVILEWGTWGRAERDALRTQARKLGATVELRYLDVAVDELWRRIQARDREDPAFTRADLEASFSAFEVPDEAELLHYDRPAEKRTLT